MTNLLYHIFMLVCLFFIVKYVIQIICVVAKGMVKWVFGVLTIGVVLFIFYWLFSNNS